jgi:hypothetical protein
MAHSILKSRFTDHQFCTQRLAAARAHLYHDLNNIYKSVFRSVVMPTTRVLVHLNLSVARLPLYSIRKLPFCLPGVTPVEFYYQQWQEDVQHLVRTRHKLQYSFYRLPDALNLAWNYGIKTLIRVKPHTECGEHCACRTEQNADRE